MAALLSSAAGGPGKSKLAYFVIHLKHFKYSYTTFKTPYPDILHSRHLYTMGVFEYRQELSGEA